MSNTSEVKKVDFDALSRVEDPEIVEEAQKPLRTVKSFMYLVVFSLLAYLLYGDYSRYVIEQDKAYREAKAKALAESTYFFMAPVGKFSPAIALSRAFKCNPKGSTLMLVKDKRGRVIAKGEESPSKSLLVPKGRNYVAYYKSLDGVPVKVVCKK